jgi:hypothetical protein
VGYDSYSLFLSSWNISYELKEDGGQQPTGTGHYYKSLMAGQWTRITVTVDFQAAQMAVAFDGDAALGGTLSLPTPTEAGGVDLLFGARWPFPNDTFSLRYDNIVCDLL